MGQFRFLSHLELQCLWYNFSILNKIFWSGSMDRYPYLVYCLLSDPWHKNRIIVWNGWMVFNSTCKLHEIHVWILIQCISGLLLYKMHKAALGPPCWEELRSWDIDHGWLWVLCWLCLEHFFFSPHSNYFHDDVILGYTLSQPSNLLFSLTVWSALEVITCYAIQCFTLNVS